MARRSVATSHSMEQFVTPPGGTAGTLILLSGRFQIHEEGNEHITSGS